MSPDEELLRRFAAGERDALGELAGRYETALLNLAWPMVGSRELAMDAVQETWLRVIRYAGSFNGHSSVKTWLYRIAINQCRSARAARSEPVARAVTLSEPIAEAMGPTEPEALARVSREDRTNGNDPPRETSTKERNEHLNQAVEHLPPDLREVILLCYTQGLTHSEAAEALGIPIGTVKSRIHAALEALRGKVKS
jgi:RNA polymerase sigma-70 factor (ECF subfamily)